MGSIGVFIGSLSNINTPTGELVNQKHLKKATKTLSFL